MRFACKMPPCCSFSIQEFKDTVMVSGHSLLHDGSGIINTEQAIKKQNKMVVFRQAYESTSHSRQGIIQIQGTHIYQIFDPKNSIYDWHLPKRKLNSWLIANKNGGKNLRKYFQNEEDQPNINYAFIQNKADFAFLFNCNSVISGVKGQNSLSILSNKLSDQWHQFSRISIHEKYLNFMSRMTNENIILSYNLNDQQQLNQKLAHGLIVLDLEKSEQIWKMQKQRTLISGCPIAVNQNCVLVGHMNIYDNSAHLALHDIRTKDLVSILDSSQADIDTQNFNPNWFPHYNMLFRLGFWSVATVWGGPAARISHIVNLDLRFPLRKQILLRNVEHPKHLSKSISNSNLWIIKNEYKQYRYTASIIQRVSI